MPTYEFSNAQGERVERWMHGDDCVPIGERVCLDGEWLTRLPSSGMVAQERVGGGEAFLAHSQPDWWPYAKNHVQRGPHRGTPLFNNRQEAREAAARARDAGTGQSGLEYDG